MLHRDKGIDVPGRRTVTARKASWLAASLALFAVSPAFGAFTCEGKVTYLGMNPEGLVQVGVGGYGVWCMCSQSTAFAGHGGLTFTPEGCRAWYATLLAAQKTGTSIRFWFTSGASSNNGPECTALGTWTQPNPAPYHMTVLE